VEDLIDITKNIQGAMSELASGPMSEVTDLTKQVRENFIEANSAANIEITGEDKLAKMSGKLSAIKLGYETISETLTDYNVKLNGITDTTELNSEVVKMQDEIQSRISSSKQLESDTLSAVAEQQQKIVQLENLRATVPSGSEKYEELTEKINQSNITLIKQETNLDAIKSQQTALQGISDGYLEMLKQQSASSSDMNELIQHRRKMYRDEIDLSKTQVDILNQQQGKINELGIGLDKYVSKFGPLNDALMNSFDAMGDGMLSFVERVPVVGGLLKGMMSGPISEAVSESKNLWQSFTDSMMNDMKDVENENGEIVKGMSFPQALAKNFKMLGGTIAGIGKKIIGTLLNPLVLVGAAITGFVVLIKGAFNEMTRLENVARDFRFQIGATAESASRLTDMSVSMENQFRGLGLNAEDVLKSTSALTAEFSSMNYVTEEQVKFVSLLSLATGVAAESIAGAMNSLMKLGMLSQSEIGNTLLNTQKMADAHGVAFSTVMDDIANAGEDVMKFIGGSAKALAKGALEARKLGTSMDSIASSAASMLDFESSVTSEMEASVMFGQHINMNQARSLAFQGKTKELAEEQLRIVQSLGGTESMNYFQKEKLVNLLGVELGTIQNMEKTAAQRKMLEDAALRGNDEARKIVERRNKLEAEALKTKQKSNDEIIKELVQMEKDNQRQESMNALVTKLQASWTDVKMALVPVAKALLPAIETVIGKIKDITGDLVSENGKLTPQGEELKDTMIGVGTAIMGIGEAVLEVGGFFASFFGESLIQNLIVIGGLFLGLKVTMGLISGLAGKITSKLFKGGGAAGGKGGILGSIANFINRIKPQNILAAAAALAIIAGALFVSAKAFQEFAKVNWDKAWPGILVLGGLVGAAMLLGKGGPMMIAGAVAIGILSLSLIPLAFALNMMKGVGLESVLVIAGSLLVLGIAAAKLGAIMMSGVGAAAILAGAFAIAALGASLIPLAYALKIAAPGIEAFGKLIRDVFSGMAEVIGSIGEVIVNVVSALGEVIVGAITAIGGAISGVITSIAGGIKTIIGAVSGAITTMVDDITRLSELDAGKLFAVSAAITAVAGAMASFGVGSAVGKVADAGGGFVSGLLNTATSILPGTETADELNKSPLQKLLDFAKEADSIISVADKMDLLINSFDRLSKMDAVLEKAATSMINMGEAFKSLGQGLAQVSMASTASSIGNAISGFFGGETQEVDPIEKIIGFMVRLSEIQIDTKSLEIISQLNLGDFVSTISDGFGEKIAILTLGMGDLLAMFSGINAKVITDIETLSISMPKFIGGLANALPRLSTSDLRGLKTLATALNDFFVPINKMSFSKMRELPNMGLAIDSLVDGLDGVETIPGNVNDILESLGLGIESFFNNFENIDFGVVSELPGVTQSLIPTIKSFSELDYTKLAGSGEALKSLGYGLDQLAGYINDGEIEELMQLNKLKPTMSVINALSGLSFEKISTGMQKLATSIQLVATSLNNLNVNKINELKGLTIPGAEGPVGNQGVKGTQSSPLPSSDPFIDGSETVIEGTMKNFMVKAEPPPSALENFFMADPVIAKPEYDQTTSETMSPPMTEEMKQSLRRQVQIQQNQGGVPRIDIPVGPIQVEPPTKYDINADNYIDPVSKMKPIFTDTDYTKFVERLQIKDSDINLSTIEGLRSLMESRQTDIDNPDWDIETLGSIRMSVNQVGMYEKIIKEMELKVSDKFKALGETKMNLPTSNVFDWAEDASGTVDFGSPGVLPTIKPGTPTFDPFALVDETAGINTSSATQSKVLNDAIQNTGTTPTSIFTRIAEFASNLTPNFESLIDKFTTNEPTDTESSLSGFDTIHVSGQTVFVEEIAKITQKASDSSDQPQTSGSNREVVTKLSELISLMKRGGISVNMDGKKVSKGVASARD
jgi:hypothetical protein